MEELNSGQPKTNPSSGREEGLNPGPLDYKSSALTTRPRCLLNQKLLNKILLNTVLFIMLFNMVLTFKSVDGTLICDHAFK